jgi:hypothetical protein
MSLRKPSLISAVAHTPSLLNVFSVGADRVIRHKAIQPESSWDNLTSTTTSTAYRRRSRGVPTGWDVFALGGGQLHATLGVERDRLGRMG